MAILSSIQLHRLTNWRILYCYDESSSIRIDSWWIDGFIIRLTNWRLMNRRLTKRRSVVFCTSTCSCIYKLKLNLKLLFPEPSQILQQPQSLQPVAQIRSSLHEDLPRVSSHLPLDRRHWNRQQLSWQDGALTSTTTSTTTTTSTMSTF